MVNLEEAFLATEHVLEEVFYEEVMKYESPSGGAVERSETERARMLPAKPCVLALCIFYPLPPLRLPITHPADPAGGKI